MDDKQANQVIEPTTFERPPVGPGKSSISINPLKALLAAVFLILTLAALFMFSASAVRFEFNPEVVRVEISGSLPAYPLGGRYLMLPGDYRVETVVVGYEPFSADVSVEDKPEQEFSFELTKLPGTVEVQANHEDEQVPGAKVYIDQQLMGTTPLTIDRVPAGARDLYVTHERFLPFQTEIEVAGLRQQQLETVDMSPAWADLSISSLPAAASISVDGREVSETPAIIEVIQGVRVIRLKKAGYKSWETELEIEAQQDIEFPDIVLAKSDGKLAITSEPAGANITIAGKYRGQTPLSIELAPAEGYGLVATRAGYEAVSRRFSIEPEEDRSINLVLKPVTGQVRITAHPAEGILFINDQERGQPNQTLNLTARTHTIRIEQEGYATFVTDIIPQPGFPQQVNVMLQTVEEAKVAAIPQRVTTALGDVLRFIVPGSFRMGAGRREPGRRSNEVEKQVELTRAYYLGEKEITNQSFAQYDPTHDSGILGRALLSEPDRPVVNVSWEKAVQFLNWLSGQDQLPAAYEFTEGQWKLIQPATTGYRLPTEAEWAWAARYASDSATRFPWGDNMPPTPGAGNFADESAANMVPYSILGYNDNYRGPAPPGEYSPNPLGLYDLAGNVSEWMHDYYSVDLHRETLVDPDGPDNGDYHVIRGSNYANGRFSALRWTYRDYGAEGRPDVGFRIARYLE